MCANGDEYEGCRVTNDAFLDGQLMVLQPESGYRAGLDAVVLAASLDGLPASGACVLDLGAGVGVVGLCVAVRHPQARVTLLEREPVLAGLAARNIDRNVLSERVQVAKIDLEAAVVALDRVGISANRFDYVLANPPFLVEGRGKPPPDPLRAAAHVMSAGGIERWVRFMARVTRPGGTAVMIHRVDALLELLNAFDGRFGAIEVTPICPRPLEQAVRVLVRGIKGSKAPLQLNAPLPQAALTAAAKAASRRSD